MNEKYRHLSVEDRAVIMIERGSGVSMHSISRELKHNQARVQVSRSAAEGPKLGRCG